MLSELVWLMYTNSENNCYYTINNIMSAQSYRSQADRLKAIDALEPAAGFQDKPYPYAQTDMFFRDKYGDLGRSLARTFRAKAAASQDADLVGLAQQENVHLGFLTMSRILSFAPDAYGTYVRAKRRTRSVEDLGHIVSR